MPAMPGDVFTQSETVCGLASIGFGFVPLICALVMWTLMGSLQSRTEVAG